MFILKLLVPGSPSRPAIFIRSIRTLRATPGSGITRLRLARLSRNCGRSRGLYTWTRAVFIFVPDCLCEGCGLIIIFLRPSARCCVIILGIIFWSSCRVVFRIGNIRRLLPPSVLVHVMGVSKEGVWTGRRVSGEKWGVSLFFFTRFSARLFFFCLFDRM